MRIVTWENVIFYEPTPTFPSNRHQMPVLGLTGWFAIKEVCPTCSAVGQMADSTVWTCCPVEGLGKHDSGHTMWYETLSLIALAWLLGYRYGGTEWRDLMAWLLHPILALSDLSLLTAGSQLLVVLYTQLEVRSLDQKWCHMAGSTTFEWKWCH